MSKTDLFIEELLHSSGYDYNFMAIHENAYLKAIEDAGPKLKKKYIKDLDIWYNVDNQPFPLFPVKVVIDRNSGYDGTLAFVFKHKGKHYYYYEFYSE